MREQRLRWNARLGRKVVMVAALASFALALPSVGSSVVNLDDLTPAPLGDFDSRDAAQPSAAQLSAASALGANVEWNSLGAPGSIIKYGGYLATSLAAPDATTAARQWLDANATLFGLGSSASLTLWSSAPLTGSNVYGVTFRQSAGGIASSDGVVTVAVVPSARSGWDVVYASSTLAPDQSPTGSYAITPSAAYAQAASATGAVVSALGVQPLTTKAGTTTLDVAGSPGTQTVEKTRFVTPDDGARAAYQTTIVSNDDGSLTGYDVVVDAETGGLLYRQNVVNNISNNPTWSAFSNAPKTSPINKYPWGYPTSDTRETWCWTAINGCTYVAGDTSTVYPLGVASKMPWDVNPNPTTGVDLGTTQTTGNNVDDIRLWSGSHGAFGSGYHPTSATRDYQYPYSFAWYIGGCNPALLTGSGNDIDAAVTNLFAMHNRMHDFSYYLGFDEPHWNAQQYNNGLGGVANDAVLGNAQAGALTGSRDNANMSTGADGGHPQTNMFLWQSLAGAFYAPCVDGDYDMSVIGHEYGHAIENRMIGKGVGARQGNYTGGMGEAFGDFDVLEYLNANHYAPVLGSDEWTEGAYATGNHYNGIRDFLASEPMGGDLPEPRHNPETDPLNLGDYGFDIVGPEVHADGEIWVAVEHDIRQLLLGRYPANGASLDIACARGKVPVAQCPGDRRWIQLYYDSMVLMPRNATILQARDAMLAADQARFGGADLDLLWHGFAQRGFGQLATTTNNNDTNPVPDFSSALSNNATLTFNAVAADGNPLAVKARIYVGDYQAGVTQIADTDPATTAGTNSDATAQFVPSDTGNDAFDTYNFVAVAPGYGHVRFAVTNLGRGQSRQVTIKFGTNLASATQGATATGDGTSQGNLIDDNEGTVWNSTGAPVAGRQVVIDLAGTAPAKLRWANVSAFLTPANNRFTALRSFALYACTAGDPANPTCSGAVAGGWKKMITSEDDAFPSVNPRPVAPDMTLRGWQLPITTATHVKFVVLTNQCTGQTSYQGDQDSDPANNADCRPTRGNEVHAAEVQLFSAPPSVGGQGVSTVDT